jgi:hypothetical protein
MQSNKETEKKQKKKKNNYYSLNVVVFTLIVGCVPSSVLSRPVRGRGVVQGAFSSLFILCLEVPSILSTSSNVRERKKKKGREVII